MKTNNNKLILNTILNYPGNKSKFLNKYDNIIDLKGKKYFIDMFCGSLVVLYMLEV